MTEDILRIRDFTPNLTEYSKIESNTFGGKKMWVNYQGRKKFTLQLPRMHAPFGVSDFVDATTGKTKYYLNLSFSKEQEMKGVVKMFHDKLAEWDDKVVDDASNNTLTWFKKPATKLTKNVIKKNYTPMLARYKDKETLEFTGEYPDKVKLKVPFWDDKFTVEVYDENQNRVDISYIKPNSEIIAVVKSSNVWISADKFGVSLNAGVLQVFPPERLTGYSFLPDLEEQAVEEPSVPQPAPTPQPSILPEEEDNVPTEEEQPESGANAESQPEAEVEAESQPESQPEPVKEEEDDVQIQSESDEVVEPEPEPAPKEEKKPAKRAPPARATGTAVTKKPKSALDSFKK